MGEGRSATPVLSVLLLTLSSLLQAVFIILVGKGILFLDWSTKFAAPGLPVSIAALVLAIRKKQPSGLVPCAIVAIGMWCFLCTVH